MIPNSEQWIGQVVAGKFPLAADLGGSGTNAVFLIEKGTGVPAETVLRVTGVNSASAGEQFEHWKAAARLSHPNLIQIFETGRCQIADNEFFYVLSEHAEENLAQIVPERLLSAEEARQVLKDVVSALAYLHGQGLVHGGLKPSNIFALGETVKISSDKIRPAGKPPADSPSAYDAPEAASVLTPASDVWSLGVVLSQALTAQLPSVSQQKASAPSGMPQPFQEIVENCLQVEPVRRWTIGQIADCLGRVVPAAIPEARASAPSASARPAPRSESPRSAKWLYAIPLVAVIVLVIILLERQQHPASQPATPAVSEPSSSSQKAASAGPGAEVSPSVPNANPQTCCDGQVAERTMPAISASAQRTIQGKIRVVIDLTVDETGKVSEARFKSAGPSRYFAERCMDAARRWKFEPPRDDGRAVASQWRIKFMIGRRTLDDRAEQIAP